MRKYLLLISCAALFSCSTRNYDSAPRDGSGFIVKREIVDQCGAINSRSAQAVIESVRARLLVALSRKKLPDYPITITFVACKEPMAYALGNGEIILSQGLLKKLSNEAELAFVVAHELSHEVLHHSRNYATSDSSLSPSDYGRTLEFEADRSAVGMVSYAGYDPYYAIQALNQLTKVSERDVSDAGYPSTTERLQTLRAIIEQAQWQPPGIINRRAFVVLRSELSY